MRSRNGASLVPVLRLGAALPWFAVFVLGVMTLVTLGSAGSVLEGAILYWLSAVTAFPLLLAVTFWRAESRPVYLLNTAAALLGGLVFGPLVLHSRGLIIVPWALGTFVSPLLALAAFLVARLEVSTPEAQSQPERAKRRRRLMISLVAAAAVIVLGSILLVRAAIDATPEIVWELPQGYRGWILVEYERADCPPLPKQGADVIVPVGSSGRLCTSTTIDSLPDLFIQHPVYRRPDGTWEEVRETGVAVQFSTYGRQIGPSGQREFGTAFFGTKAELDGAWAAKPKPEP